MQIYTEINKNENLSLALGFFDGVHKGHQKVIKSAVEFAQNNNLKSAVITFKEHPCCYLWGVSPKYILTKDIRRQKISELGIDYLYELDFEQISKYSAEEYLKNFIVAYFNPSAISTGWNHSFGHNKSGNSKVLRDSEKIFGYKYFEISPQKCGNEIISSTTIRKYLSKGDIKNANKMLGYNFSVSGEVIQGNQIGRTIGFKTANINYPLELIEIPYGVYSVSTNIGKGIANYGIRPTVNGEKPVLEVHIIDFDKDIYGKYINVEFVNMIRNEKKFDTLEDLKKQIAIDICKINK